MNDSEKKNASPSNKDGDGIRVIEHGTRASRSALFYKLLALVLVGCFAAYLLKTVIHRATSQDSNASANQLASDESESPASNASDIASSQAASLRGGQLTARPSRQTSRDPNDLANYVAPGQAPKMEEVIERLHDAGIHSGLGAFNPPGTSPPMIGLAVPDDYVLPEGYVRHFQATDDGQRIEPILMYSPDFEFFDSNGQAIVIPENRVVPGNMAPPGFAIRPIQIPQPLEPGGR
ncbi:MAG: hypothetical protein ACREPB_01270 [Arenimonas sp.]